MCYLSHCLLNLFISEEMALVWSEPKNGIIYVGIIRSLALATHCYKPHAMLCWQTVSLPTFRLLFNLPNFLGLFPGGLPPAQYMSVIS